MIDSYIHSYNAHASIIHVIHFVCVYNVTQRCCNVIDTSQGQYCEYHVGSEMKKLNAKRANLQNWGNRGMCICDKVCVCMYVDMCVLICMFMYGLNSKTTDFSE